MIEADAQSKHAFSCSGIAVQADLQADRRLLMTFLGAFHHVGLACRSIEEESAAIGVLGYASEGPPIEDPIQKVRIQFFSGPGPRIELIEPTAADSPVAGILKRGTKFYHFAYEVENLEEMITYLKEGSFHVLGASAPARAFGLRHIIFLMAPTGTLIELIARN